MLQHLVTHLTDLFTTIIRGSERPTLSSLDRLISSAGAAHVAARRALAVAIAEEEREEQRRTNLVQKVTDLEHRAVLSLKSNREDLAIAASEAIASLATEIEASHKASLRFSAEVTLARREVDAQRRRLADLDRGRRLARVGAALNSVSPNSTTGLDRFADAEDTLARIESDNHNAKAIREEMTSLPDRLIEQMSDLGFGAPVVVRPSDVMTRLHLMASGTPSVEFSHSTEN
jgi:phage shock protein A